MTSVYLFRPETNDFVLTGSLQYPRKLQDLVLLPDGRPMEIVQSFGGTRSYLQAVRQLRQQIYAAA